MSFEKNLPLAETDLEKVAGGKSASINFAMEDFLNQPTEEAASLFLKKQGFGPRQQENFDLLMSFWKSSR